MNLIIFFFLFIFLLSVIILIIFILIYKKRYRNEIFFFMHIDIVSDSSSPLNTLSPLKINYKMIDKFRMNFLCFQ